MGRQGRLGGGADAGRPSGVSRDRLAQRMRADVADVRVRLEEAVLRTDALLASGQPERAAEVLDEQHALLAELQDTLASAVAAASVEAEAEAVLVGSAGGPELFGGPASPAPDRDEPGIRRSARTTASALASAMAALALLVVAAPTPTPRTLASSDVDDVVLDARGSTAVGTTAGADGVTSPAAPGRIVGPNELEVRRFFTSPTASDRRDAAGPSDELAFGLSELQALVDQFVATVVRAAGGLAADLPADDPAAPAPHRPRPADVDGASVPAVPSGDPATTSPEPTEADAGEDASGDPAEAPSLPPLPSSDAPAEDGATAGDGATAEDDAPAEEAPAEEEPAEGEPAEEEAPADDGTSTGDGDAGSGVPTLK